MKRVRASGNGRRLETPQSVNAAIKSICDVMRRSNCAGAMQYVPELTWLLFLRILDERESREAENAEAVGADFTPSLHAPYRWRDWAARPVDEPGAASGQRQGWKRKQLEDGSMGAFFAFVNGELLPYLRDLRNRPNASPKQKIISEIMSGVERVRIDTERNLRDVLDKIDDIKDETIEPTHVFPLSQVYEGLLLKMGENGERRRAVLHAARGDPGDRPRRRSEARGNGLRSLLRHGIDEPHLWHGNTLTGNETYGGLFEGAPALFDVVLTNPPFGGKEGKEAQTRFAYKTGATQVLFLQHVIDSLKENGRCGMVLDEGVLFRTNETAFVQTKRKLLDSCDVWCIVSLPSGVFTAAGAGVKTNLAFFTRGRPTEQIWYYDLSDLKVGKKSPLTLDRFDDFFRLLPQRADSERSWTLPRQVIEEKGFDLKAVNPNAPSKEDTRTPEDLLALIDQKGREVAEALAALRGTATGDG